MFKKCHPTQPESLISFFKLWMCGSLSIGADVWRAAPAWRGFCRLWLARGWHSRKGDGGEKGKIDANHLSWREQGVRETEADRDVYTERCLCLCQCPLFSGVRIKSSSRIKICPCSALPCLHIWGTAFTCAAKTHSCKPINRATQTEVGMTFLLI